ncbi:hypothetical protein [Paenibacillus glacialis]|uniref:Uncharacterized protein n=1 Tax=Paenibacillus glacialis TaxID=494026 RepID=A0A168N100_9BACL|nr:hypothetical protein [Paenibacillus glacialis]OAB45269.1 hypothetical protein PGLA_03150 [Paenibacillus glacialis]
MTIFATIIAILVAILLSIVLGGPYGILILIAITFGVALSTHIRTKEIQLDLQRIKEKLGIKDKDDFNMTDQEIEEELEEYIESESDDKKS